MKFSIFLLYASVSFGQVDQVQVEKIIQKSKETRSIAKKTIKDRNPAANKKYHFTEFSKLMEDDKSWQYEIDNVIKEFE